MYHFDNSNIVIGKMNSGFPPTNKVFYSDDNGVSWHTVTGVSVGTSFDDIFKYNGELIAYVYGSNSIYHSTDGGISWYTTTNEFTISHMVIKDSVFIATSNHSYYYSEDNGETWIQSVQIPDSTSQGLYVSENVIISNNYDGLYYSEDDGKTWNKININNFGDNERFGNKILKFNSLLITHSTNYNNTIKLDYYSEDNGKTWSKNNKFGLPLCIDGIYKIDDNYIIIADDNYNQSTFYTYYSMDNGHTWTKIDNIGTNIRDIVYINSTVIMSDRTGVSYANIADFFKLTDIKYNLIANNIK